MMAFRWAMRCTPIASVMVMMAGKPSGMAATAIPTAAAGTIARTTTVFMIRMLTLANQRFTLGMSSRRRGATTGSRTRS